MYKINKINKGEKMMSILVKYEVNKKEDDMVMYCSEKMTMRDIQERISSILKEDCKILYVKF